MEGQDFFGAVAQANGGKLVDECGDLGAAIEYARKAKGMKR
jgi:ClpP class serine protease